MSKSRGNVVNPDDVIKEYGADTLRTFILFIGDYEKPAPWSQEGAKGCWRFLNRVWNLQDMIKGGAADKLLLAQTVKKVTEDYESVKFNTAIAQLMTAVNAYYARGNVTKEELNAVLIWLYPVAPHMASEMFETLNGKKINDEKWIKYNPADLATSTVDIPVQINGKLRARINAAADITEEELIARIKSETNVLNNTEIVKAVYVKGRIINIVCR